MLKKEGTRILIFFIILILIASIIFVSLRKDVQKSPDSDCITILKNPNSFDVVFLSYKHPSNEDFIKSVNNYVYGANGFASIEPFKSHLDRLSFYAVYTDSVQCDLEQGTLICDDYTSKKVASKCPNDYVFILSDRNNFVDALIPIRSSAYLNIGSINTADNELVVMHEFAHLFGKLVDEYVDDVSYKGFTLKNSPNCDDKDCGKWKDFPNTKCLKGCALSTFYRSQDFTIMRNYFKSKEFGAYNEWLLNKSLE